MLPALPLPTRRPDRLPRRRRGAVALLAALVAALALAALPPAAQAARTLAPGSQGADVQQLNQRLAALGFLPAGSASRSYDSATTHGVLAFQKWQGLARDGVAGPATAAALATALRPRPTSSGGPGRRIEVLIDRQVALLIRDNRVRRIIAVSTGRAGYDTPMGSFRVFRKEVRSWSYPYSVWLPYASYFTGGVAFHGYASVPAYAASHGCVRVPFPFMRELYRFARRGTPVRVHSPSSARSLALPAPPIGAYGP